MTIIEKIQEVMDWNGIEQKKLAELTGLSKSTISTYMRGVNKISIENLQKIADALGVSLWTLLNGEPMAVTPLDLTEAERALIGKRRALSEKSQKFVDAAVQTLGELEHRE